MPPPPSGSAANRSATVLIPREDAAQRSVHRQRARSEERDAVGAATATKETDKYKYITRLWDEHAANDIMLTMPTRCLPDVVLEHPHQAHPRYHQDWTLVEGSDRDPEQWELEHQLRDRRNLLIQKQLVAGLSVFYKSSGQSMWPLVQSGDACTFHPIQAVTAKAGTYSIQKEASKIDVGDVVFCIVQPKRLFYAHLVHQIQQCYHRKEPKYFIGNIEGTFYNGWCYREHIFGVLVDVQVFSDGAYYSRPHPKNLFKTISALVTYDRWNSAAYNLCVPQSVVPQ
jgi:hypothetical protein